MADPGPPQQPSMPRDQRRVAMAASLAVAVLMLVGKLTAYFITGSSAILADALESVIHLFATALAAFGLWYSSQPADVEHPYGHGKIAYFTTAFEGLLIFVASLVIIVTATHAWITGPELQQLGLGLLITGILAAINGALGFTLISVGKKHNSIVLVANGQHTLTDMWTSLGVLVGVGLVWMTGAVWLDPLAAILVGLNIIWTSWRLIRNSFHGLMERADTVSTEQISSVLEDARQRGLVVGWHQLRHRRVNDTMWIEVHLLFPSDLTITEAHRRATVVEASVRDLFPGEPVSITSHLEPDTHDHPAGDHEPDLDALRPWHS